MDGKKPVISVVGSDLSYYNEGDNTIVTVEGMVVRASESANAPLSMPEGGYKPSVSVDDSAVSDIAEWENWGDNDLFPEELITKLAKLGVVKTAIDVNADLHYGAGIVWVKDVYNKGKVIHEVQNVPEWRKFCRDTGYLVTHGELIQSLEMFYMAFPEFLLDAKTNKPISIRLLDTPRARLGKKNAAGRIEKVYYNVHSTVDIENHGKPAINTYNPQQPIKYNKFVYPMAYRTFGNVYYSEPNYYATFRAGWADTAIQIANFMSKVYTNMISIKYHLIIPISSLRSHYKEWDQLDQKEQLAKLVEYKQNIDTNLSSAENAGKTVYSVVEDGQEAVRIEPIKNYLDSSRELPSNIAANSEMLFALGTDPALVGLNNPGGSGDLNGSGGSDKRESRKNSQSNLKREREVSLQVVNLWAKLMGIPDDIYPMYMDTDTSQTMDENPTGKQNVLT